jgi:hypothetical protein
MSSSAEILDFLKSNNIPIKKWGATYRVKARSATSNRMTYIGISKKPIFLKRIVSEYNLNSSSIKEFKSLKSDQYALNAINHTSGKYILPLSQFNRIRKDIVAPADKKLLIHLQDSNGLVVKTYHLQDRHINIENLFIDEENQYSSGADVALHIIPSTLIEIEWLNNPPRSRSERKNFFRYITKAEYNLHEFQVYHDLFIEKGDEELSYDPEKDPDIDAHNYPCFLFALLKAGVDAKIVKQISQTMFSSGATVDFIKKTAKHFNLCISVKQYYLKPSGRPDSNITIYGDKNLNIIELGSVGEHLFAIKRVEITKAALDNPKLVEKHNRTDFIVKRGKAYFNNKEITFLTSYSVISYLFHRRDTLLDPITQRNMPYLLNNKYQEIRSLNQEDFNDSNFKAMGRGDGSVLKNGQIPFRSYDNINKKFVDQIKYNIVYFDFETLVKDDVHEPYCVSYSIASIDTSNGFVYPSFSQVQCIYKDDDGDDCAIKFLESLPKDSFNLLWAHNVGFDCRFLLKHMSFKSKDTNMIDSGSSVKQARGFYKGREIVFKDTRSFIQGPLANLPSMFKDATSAISLEKECFPHNLINKSNYRSLWPIEYLNSYKDKDTLIANATKIGAIIDGKFDCKNYAIHYCNRDVDVLKSCFESFRNLVFHEFNLDVYHFLSISSLSLAYQHNEGCFDGCYEISSVLLGFMREATVGGRVMTRNNEKHHIEHKLADFDAVSLYPSAMAELNGYVKGKPKLFKVSIPTDADYYIARVSFDSIDIKRHFPLLSFYQDGSRNFTNDLDDRTMIIGKQALEDIQKFQGAKFTVLEGVYWNEGFNDQITKTIRKMFDARLRYKAEKNPLQNVFKLMMNSSYGKLLMKPIVKKKVFVSGGSDKIDAYTRKNVHRMISRTPINTNLALFEEHKTLTEHFSPVHLGIQVLDSSKHIMNRVMCLAEDIDAKIWYQDTDSMMIDYDAVPRLDDAFKQKYGKDLIGKDMGQFHVDFELNGSEGNIYAKESIFLGKKSYLGLLACDGNDVEGFHIRMKGIPSKLLEDNVYDKYMTLYNGGSMSFDLSELCSIQIDSKSQKVMKRTNFTRNVSF